MLSWDFSLRRAKRQALTMSFVSGYVHFARARCACCCWCCWCCWCCCCCWTAVRQLFGGQTLVTCCGSTANQLQLNIICWVYKRQPQTFIVCPVSFISLPFSLSLLLCLSVRIFSFELQLSRHQLPLPNRINKNVSRTTPCLIMHLISDCGCWRNSR